MTELEHLPEITEKALGGLTADDALKQRILAQADQKKIVPLKKKSGWARYGAAAAAAVLAVGLAGGIPLLTRQPDGTTEPVKKAMLSADGSVNTVNLLDEHLDEESTGDAILMVTRKAGAGTVDRERADLGNGSFSMQSSAVSSGRGIWAEASGTFPLVNVDGRCYRLLTDPAAVPESLLGGAMGNVTVFSGEPALAGNSGVISNTVPEGEPVYGISGMEGTLVAARVDGTLRAFQRVSFNGNALRGGDTLRDTLQLAGHVSGMELSGVGTVSDSATCEQLLSTLLSNASYESSGSVSGTGVLLMHLDNGLTVQMAVKDERLAACGVWSCPEFFEAFSAAAQ